MTSEDVDAIDVVLADGRGVVTTVCDKEISRSVNDTLREAGFVGYADLRPWRPRSIYERSFWLRRFDGRCAPELHVLATLVYGRRLRPNDRPYWTDANPDNTSPTNVTIATSSPRPTRSKYGRSGTPEYWRRYWADPVNKQRARENARKAAQRRRDRIKAAEKAIAFEKLARSLLTTRSDGS